MDDHLYPRPNPTRDYDGDRWRQMNESEYSYFGPVALIVALVLGLLIYTSWANDNRPNTQLGQNVEQSTTPDSPRNPNLTK